MKHIKGDAMRILAEVSMEQNDGDVVQSFKDVKEIDDLLGLVKAKSLINHSKGRKSNREKRFDEVFRARITMKSCVMCIHCGNSTDGQDNFWCKEKKCIVHSYSTTCGEYKEWKSKQ